MSKSVYSLVLSDDIIKAADNLAYKLGISRSALIDRILAEQLSVVTPQSRMRDIMETFATLFESDMFRLIPATADGSMQLRSPLPYKYKPTIRYSVELSSGEEYLGQLKISFRTQNAALLQEIANFWEMYAKTEMSFLREIGIWQKMVFTINYDKATRLLLTPAAVNGYKGEITPEITANVIADYVRFLDKQIKTYFEYTEDKQKAAQLITAQLADRAKSTMIII